MIWQRRDILVSSAQPTAAHTARLEPRSGVRATFGAFAWSVLAFNLAVVLWGAFVRATGSGAGCGNHWPNCNGAVLPRSPQLETLIEFAHRASSGLLTALVVGLIVGAVRLFPRGHPARLGAWLSGVFLVLEALIGAGLVRFGLVADNASVSRVVVMGVHLLNTLLLTACLTLTARWASGASRIRLRAQGARAWLLGVGVVLLAALTLTGAIAALGDTLFPARTLAEGLRQDLTPSAHFLLRLRAIHPFLAVAVAAYAVLVANGLAARTHGLEVRRWARALTVLVLVQLAAGAVNVGLLAPVWMQLVHLLLADLVWIAWVLLCAAVLANAPRLESLGDPRYTLENTVQDGDRVSQTHPRRRSSLEPSSAANPDTSPLEVGSSIPGAERATIRHYLALTKPRVISLLLFTTLASMLIAARGWPGTILFLTVALGGYAMAGAANAINMVIDRDIDARMGRTSRRPTVTRIIPSGHALAFALALVAGSFALLWLAANPLTAWLALAGLGWYVLVYTLGLKRRSWLNIVIGGAAGAFPALVGWAAVRGELAPLAWVLFAVVFMWTPVHFWALALLIRDDYARAGVPMLPVVLGERATVAQIVVYAILTVAVAALPVLMRQSALVYALAAVPLNGLLLVRSAQLYRTPERSRARSLYKFSMLYLALAFAALALDRALKGGT